MSVPNLTACPNCTFPEFTTRFCPECGQKRPHRLSVGHVLHELLHVFTHAVVGYVPQVLLHPGRIVADYLAGRRKHYFNPFQFLLLVVGFAAAAAALLHYYDVIGDVTQRRYGRMGAVQAARMGEYFHYLGKYYNLWWLLLLLPVYSLLTWLVYRRQGLNYAECFFVHVIIGSAFHVYQIVLWLALWALRIQVQAMSNTASLLQVLTVLLYLALISRQGLGMRWGPAIGRASLVVVLSVVASAGLNYLAFYLYVFR
jgi:hypothetical protein